MTKIRAMNEQIQELRAVNLFTDAHVDPKNGTDASFCNSPPYSRSIGFS